MKKLLVVGVASLAVSAALTGSASATADSYITSNWSASNDIPNAPTYKIYSTQRSDAFTSDSIPITVNTVYPSGVVLFIHTVECSSTKITSNTVSLGAGQSATMNMVSSTGCFRLAITATNNHLPATAASGSGTLRYQI